MKKVYFAAGAAIILPLCGLVSSAAMAAVEISDIRDSLDRAVAGPGVLAADSFKVYVDDREEYDSNVYRLSPGIDIASVVGAGASKQDHINSPGAGLEGQWGIGRQAITLELNAQDNRYARNTDLNNVSSADQVVWNWGVGGVLTGQVGLNYIRGLAGFANALSYAPDIYQQANYFAAARYQVGPRWSIYGGILNSAFSVGQTAAKGNNYGNNSAEVGFDFVSNLVTTIGLDYRYSDSRFPNEIVLTGTSFNPDFKDERVRILFKRSLSDKTVIDLNGGYLKRTYANSLIGSFSGPVWSGTLGWQPTDKTQLLFAVSQNLRAYLTDQTNYYRSTAASISPVWAATEKISFSLAVARERQTYIGSSPLAVNESARRDTFTGETVKIAYAATSSLMLDVSFHYEKRNSNQLLRTYADDLASAGVRFAF